MKIDGKEVGFLYSIGADCDIDDEMQKIGVNDFPQMIERMGVTKAYVKLAAIMNKWWALKKGADPISETDFLTLNAGQLDALQKAVIKALEDGRKTEIKTKPVQGKNAESAVQ